FLFTSPFTRRQIVLYRLLPNYLFALVQAFVFLILFESHLPHPLLAAVCLLLFQIACFHLETAMAIFAGAISEALHHRLRCMRVWGYLLLTAVYFRAAWDIHLVPSFATSPVTQLLFYPAVTLADVGPSPPFRHWALQLISHQSATVGEFMQPALYVTG